jgi:hypothetical protein
LSTFSGNDVDIEARIDYSLYVTSVQFRSWEGPKGDAMTVSELRKIIVIWMSLYKQIYPHSSLLSEYTHSSRLITDAYHQKEFLLDSLANLEVIDSLRGTAVEDNLREAIILSQMRQHHLIPAIFRNLLFIHNYIETTPILK